MIRPSLPYWLACSRRARARSSIAVSAGVSSMWIGASLRLPRAPVSRSQSSSLQPPGAQLCWSSAPDRADHAHRELRRRPFPWRRSPPAGRASSATCSAMLSAKRGLAHRRAPGDDDQVAGLQARGHPVEIGEAGRHAGDVGRIVAVVELVDALDHLGQQRLDLAEPLLAARARLGDLEDPGLGLVEHVAGAAPDRVVGEVGDLAGRRRELAQHRALAHDLGVAADVGGGRHVLRQRAEIREAADVVELAASPAATRRR